MKHRVMTAFFSILLALAMLLAAVPACADNPLLNTVWTLSGYKEGGSLLMFLDSDSAYGWLGDYLEITFLDSGRYQYYERSENNGVYTETGTWQTEGSSVRLTADNGSNSVLTYSNGMLVYTENSFELYMLPSGSQQLISPNGSVVATAGSASRTESGGSFDFNMGGGGTRDNGSSSAMAGTHWVGTGLSTEMIDGIEFDSGMGSFSIGDLMGMITFVPSESMLQSGLGLATAYTALDLNGNGTFTLTLKMAALGQVMDDDSTNVNGTWSYSNGLLTLTAEGQSLPCIVNGNTLSIGISGLAIQYEKR